MQPVPRDDLDPLGRLEVATATRSFFCSSRSRSFVLRASATWYSSLVMFTWDQTYRRATAVRTKAITSREV
jgi:hypothetical protein